MADEGRPQVPDRGGANAGQDAVPEAAGAAPASPAPAADDRAAKIAAARAAAAASAAAAGAGASGGRAAAAAATPAAPAAPAKPAAPAAPPLPAALAELKERLGTPVEGAEYDPSNDLSLGYVVPRERLLECCRHLRDLPATRCDYLSCLAGVDYPEYVEVVYCLFSTADPAVRIVLRTRAPKDDCSVPSVAALWPGAGWHEREAYDLLGVRFDGHPDLRRILLPENWQGGYPLRKDFEDKRPPKERQIRVR